ncbi:FMN adenylyltransferase (EC 2.7.7.2)/riboflavin kinase (EC 2.7.1.26) [Streptoalloteichus tenebrarius]|uniref:Riboflavin biosynthesis protein n=1 Tax=Streptoalloteichus tenebrarius (strain ATCC 17920 / DSM 40477 / JCM 4838 / CBS 697.72 / NBRC 16177 / NCIMB 11028 / NRRL B-12390 / A12253. 1 / ISP 5477) TaxID=1933 RepID=A0ABT1HN20_STRSD|nr:bifunctional riboflavin kinase/FAD synthetase [Streptoalloteichus tenebrarius]MCP2256906.1 FMN adenylyltransferase (EC 2.7.7.2)/riboflavin kinase (EC 2.7.1.26) [Streptoalloteichus tenebrarius]BFF00186.1 bifunctional riboflavin kinase/FAD synthetase [Streptoalloteichus tenebrarius]
MQRWRGLENLPGGWGRCVVTIGVFDGVHRGHQQLIGRAVRMARERGLPCVLMTFDPHPAEVVRPGSHPAQLTTLRRRAELVEELGVDVFCVLPFTPELSRVPADEFVHEVLVDRLHAAAVVVGENFTFGHRAAGDVASLRRLGERFGFVTEGAGLVSDSAEGGAITFSSTYIRSCVDAGDVAAAARALGRPHRLEGIVVRGDGRGRDLGFPTANLSTPRFAAIPADGVYACRFIHVGHGEPAVTRSLPAAVSVGTNPTFSGRERRVEAYVLDVNEDFYGERVALDFVARLRGMERFATTEALIDEMRRDVERTRQVLATGEG